MHYSNLGKTLFETQDKVVEQIHDGDTIAIGGFWFVRLPMTFVEELITQKKKNLTVITQASGLAVEQLVKAGLVKKVIYSFVSLDLLGLAPCFRKEAEEGNIEFEEMTALQMNNALEASRLGMPFGVHQPPYESEFNKKTDKYTTMTCGFTGKSIGMSKAITPDVALIHAQQADSAGNIAITGALGIDRLYIGASKKTFVSVEEKVEKHSFRQDFRTTIFPRFLFSSICVKKGAAYPTSCLPYYATDYETLLEGNSLNTISNDEKFTKKKELLNRLAQVTSDKFIRKLKSRDIKKKTTEPYTVDELMICFMAGQLKDNMVTTVGSNTPIAFVSYMLAKSMHAPNAVIIPYTGMVDTPYAPVSLTLSEPIAYHSSVAHWAIEDLWTWIYQKSLVSIEFGGCAQIDQHGKINNSQIIGTNGRLKVLLPGQAGLADILNLHQNAYYYITSHNNKRVVNNVSYDGGKYCFATKEERKNLDLPYGKMRIITNLCVLELSAKTRLLEVVQMHKGVSKQEIKENTGFDIAFSETVTTTKEPTQEQLKKIRNEIDPLGYRRLEFVSGEARNRMIKEILTEEICLFNS